MEKCVLCSRNVSLEDPDSFPSVDGIVPKAEVTARFIKTFNRVCRLVNEAGDDEKQNYCKSYACIINTIYFEKFNPCFII